MERTPPSLPVSYSYPEGFRVDKKDWHFCQRLLERYGLVLLNGELTQLQNKILEGETVFRGIKGRLRPYDMHSVELERIFKGGRDVYPLLVSVDRETGKLISALPAKEKKHGGIGRAKIRGKARDGVRESRMRFDKRFFVDSSIEE